MTDRNDGTKADRALALHEQGLSRSIIAERLGVVARNVPGMLQRARQRKVNKILDRTAETAERVKG